MGNGIKYHIITIVAIFIALGLGIFIGSMFNGEKIMITQQNKLMNELEKNIKYIAEENKKLENEIKFITYDNNLKNELIEDMLYHYVEGMLNQYNVSIININDDDIASEISFLLKAAGANIISVNSLNEAEVSENIEIEKNVNYVIIVGPNKYGAQYINTIDATIANNVKKLNIPCVIVEKSNSLYSAVDVLKNNGFSTIDNVDTVYGKISMLMVMKGTHGNFGIKSSSSSLIPDIEFSKYKEVH